MNVSFVPMLQASVVAAVASQHTRPCAVALVVRASRTHTLQYAAVEALALIGRPLFACSLPLAAYKLRVTTMLGG